VTDFVERVKRWLRPWRRFLTGATNSQWARVVMDRETARWVAGLPHADMDCLEISGDKWRAVGFRSFRSARYPEYDLCAEPLPETFDLIIAEQVFEHLLWPYRAGRNVHAMLRPGGYFLVTTPFLIRVHHYPVDCSRWTDLGLKQFLAECGFPPERVRTGSWGNRACVKANLRSNETWPLYAPWRHSLRNEPRFPVVVWGLAQKEAPGSAQ
jgi:SAM-dependent methyltransferase